MARTISHRKEEFDNIRKELTDVPVGDGFPHVNVKNYNEREESTVIEIALLLRLSWFKTLVVVPLLSILTILVLPVYLYWSPRLRAFWFYN